VLGDRRRNDDPNAAANPGRFVQQIEQPQHATRLQSVGFTALGPAGAHADTNAVEGETHAAEATPDAAAEIHESEM
jgi:hypothetical protein